MYGSIDEGKPILTIGFTKFLDMETVEDVDRLELPDPGRVRYLTQTTLSLDERDIIERLKQRFPLTRDRPRRTSAMPRKTARWR